MDGLLLRVSAGMVIAALAYFWASGFEGRFGRRPMSTPAWGWALCTFIFIPICLVALVVTEVVARLRGWKPVTQAASGSHRGSASPVSSPPSAAAQPSLSSPEGATTGMTILPASKPGEPKR